MNEMTLSNNLEQIEFEIGQFKERVGQSIWEIGRRLNHVKENDLAHGEFGKWLENMDINHNVANRFMKIAKEIPYSDTYQNIGYQALYLIATLPEEEKESELKKAEEGDPSKVRELKELKKQLKEKDRQLEKTKSELEKERNKAPETVVQEVEVEPDDYGSLKEQIESLKEDLMLSRRKYELLEQNTSEAVALESKIKQLQSQEQTLKDKVNAVEEFYDLEQAFNDFFDANMAPLRFKDLAQYLHATNAVERMQKMVAKAEMWAEEMRKILPSEGRVIAEGVYIDE